MKTDDYVPTTDENEARERGKEIKKWNRQMHEFYLTNHISIK